MKKLLFEIGTEELPANYMPNILKDLKTLALKKLQDARVPFADVTVLGTPRRLAVLVSGVEETLPLKTVSRLKRPRGLPGAKA